MSDEIFEDDEFPIPPDIPDRGEFQMPSIEELLKALDRMEGLSDENKEELRQSLLRRANGEEPDFFADPVLPNSGMSHDLLVLFLVLTVLLFIFVFFGYKLYKSLTDRERRKEEKRRQKQQKKKK
ncbi:hypothetical protein Zmor_020508 [Zophobas morio]|uniref:Uncharacterized protein n=1 Tax=Zophobas morio TaxID=2755281 RepID=A0AA38MA47_9CUCU|nr:hypothetical protein Zmor_020508 [Zophobas morio]